MTMTQKLQAMTVGLAMLAATNALAQNSNNSPAGNQPAASKEGLPSIDEVMDKATKAVGGREALDKIKTIRSVMTMNVMGSQATIENKWSREGGRYSNTKSDFGNFELGSNGKTAWRNMPGFGYQVLEGEEANQVDGQASIIMGILDPKIAKERMDRIEVVGREEFKGRACVKVYFEPKDGEGHGHMYFDEADGLPKGVQQVDITPMGQQISTIELREWKTIEGIQFFHALRVESEAMPEGALEMKITTIELNKVQESDFELPRQVKELVDKKVEKNDENADAAPDGNSDEIALDDLPEAYRDRIKTMVDQ